MTNILIPTDFTPESVKAVEAVVKGVTEGKVNILLFHAFDLPKDPFDLLGKVERNPAVALLNEPFRIACKQLKDAYPKQVNVISVRCMQGSTMALFRNFIDANDVDFVCLPDGYVFHPVHARSIDPASLFAKCGVPAYKPTPARTTTFWQQVPQSLELATQ